MVINVRGQFKQVLLYSEIQGLLCLKVHVKVYFAYWCQIILKKKQIPETNTDGAIKRS